MSSLHGYEIKDEIGSGAYGTVYRAWQPAVGREVAIKVIRPEHAGTRPVYLP
jgi:serine/threonine-protein kinase PknK